MTPVLPPVGLARRVARHAVARAALFALAVALLAAAPAAGDVQDAPNVAAEVEPLIEQADAALRTDPETLFRLTTQALSMLARHPDADLEARVRVLRCDYFNERDRDATRRELDALHALAPRVRHRGAVAAMLNCEGELHEQSGENARAMELYHEAVAVAERAHDERRLADSLFLRGALRGVRGEFPEGLVDLKRSLALYERLNLPDHVRTAGNGVASLYNRMGALDEARKHYEEALRTMPPGASRERIVAQHNLARNFERAGSWDEAQKHYLAVLAHARELGFVRGQVHALRGLAAVHSAKGDGLGALQRADEGLKLNAQVPDEPLRARLLVQRAVALRLLHRPAEGMPLLRDAIRMFQLGDALSDEGDAREQLARAAADIGDWRQAYEQQATARNIAQALLRRQIDDRFATIKVQFDTEAKEREFLLLQRENHANESALAQQRRAASLQMLAVILASALALLLAVLAWRQRQTGHEMRALAMTDELTGLPNRRQALRALEGMIAQGVGGAVLILDIDHFKRINDEHGHAAGDEVLRAAAQAWRGRLPPGAVLGRLGGEEFVALVDGGLERGIALAESLRAALAALDLSPGLGDRRVTTSVGITPLRAADTLGAVLARADAALYHAKRAGRDRVEAVD